MDLSLSLTLSLDHLTAFPNKTKHYKSILNLLKASEIKKEPNSSKMFFAFGRARGKETRNPIMMIYGLEKKKLL